MTKTKLYKFIRRLLTFLAFALAIGYLFFLFKNKLIDIELDELRKLIRTNFTTLFLVFLLMFLNWGIEVLKWKYFTIRFQKLSAWQAVKSILIGIAGGIFTPNRIGELGGRLIYIEKKNRAKAIYVNTICSISQTLVTLIFGLLATLYLANQFSELLEISSLQLKTVLLLVLIALVIVYFKGNMIRNSLKFISQKWSKLENGEVDQYLWLDRLILLGVSSLRYFVFCVQFVLLLSIFLPLNQLQLIFISVSIIFLGTTIIPSGWISDIAVRTSFSYFILETVGFEGQFGLVASILLWGVNLFIPALIGVFMLIKLNLQKEIVK